MKLGRVFRFRSQPEPASETLQVGSRSVPLLFVPHPRARRYTLRLRADGTARVTIPRGGGLAAARDFVSRNLGWLEQQLQRLAAQPKEPAAWLVGTEILFRGEPVKLEAGVNGKIGMIRFGSEAVKVTDLGVDLRPAIERHLWRLAAMELPPKVIEYAALHKLLANFS